MGDYGKMFLSEDLRLDGANFASWYMCLRETLFENDELYVIDEPLEERPDAAVDLEGYLEWYEQETIYLRVQWLVRAFMTFDLGIQFQDLSAIEIVNELKSRFIAQVLELYAKVKGHEGTHQQLDSQVGGLLLVPFQVSFRVDRSIRAFF